jgi:tetratricopeptide (TPR) repeat protein
MPCEEFVKEAEEALKKSLFGKPNPELAAYKFEEAARCFRKINDTKSAMRCLSHASKLRYDLGDILKAASLSMELGVLAKNHKEPHQEYFLTAAATYKRLADNLSQNPLKASEMMAKMAECFIEAGQCEEAARVYMESAELSLQTDNYMRAIVNLGGAMSCYDAEKNYQKAREISERVSEIWMAQGVFEKAMESYGKTASYLDKMGHAESALEFRLRAAEAAKKQNNKRFIARSYDEVGMSYLALQNKKKAGYYFFLSGEENAAVGNKPAAMEEYQKAADSYTASGTSKNAVTCILKLAQIQRSENNLSAADTEYLKSARLLEQNGDIDDAETVLKQRGEMWEGVTDFINSAHAFEEAALFCEKNGKNSRAYYEKAADHHYLNAEKLAKIKNTVLSKKEYEYAAFCFEKIGNLDRALQCFKNSGNLGEYNRLARLMGVFEGRGIEEAQNRLRQIDLELDEIEKDRRGSLLSEEDMQTLKRIYSSLKSKLEQRAHE